MEYRNQDKERMIEKEREKLNKNFNNNLNTDRNENKILDLRKTLSNYEVIKSSEKNDNLLINKNNYLLSQSSQRELSENKINNKNNINVIKQNKTNSQKNINGQISKIDNKIIDPSHIYLTPTQKIYKTLNENIIFFNKYYSKKK